MEKLRPCRESTIIRMVSIIIIVTKMVIPKQSAGTALRNPHRFLSINSLVCTHSHTNTHSHTFHKYTDMLHKPKRVVCSSGSGGFLSILVLILMNARVDPQLPFLISDQPSLRWNMPWQWGAPNWLKVWIVGPPFNHWIQYVRLLELLLRRATRTDVEFVKYFTPVRFPNLSILPKMRFSHNWGAIFT